MRKLGKLTKKIYRRLCRDGPLTYAEISERTNIQLGTAYAAVKTLKRRGLVKVQKLLFASQRRQRGGYHVVGIIKPGVRV